MWCASGNMRTVYFTSLRTGSNRVTSCSDAIMNISAVQRKDGPVQTNERTLAHNTIWNLSGYAAPLLAALIAIPILIRSLGTAQYGALTIAWGVVGYFSV